MASGAKEVPFRKRGDWEISRGGRGGTGVRGDSMEAMYY